MPEFLVCPMCKVVLIQKGNTLCCGNCGLECVLNEGIYDFIGEHGSYWGEILLEEMEETLQTARVAGWRAAARNVGFKYPNLNEYILSNARIDWLFHCLDFSKTKSCLDLGSGWGTIAFGLAKYYDEVWSLEAVKQRIEFQKIRREQDKVNNIKFVRSDWLRLPFDDNRFDLVVANGVLEWLGLSDYSRNPRELQLDFLQEVKRVLKPGGCLYIGIENRFGLSFLLGGKDHSGLPFTSILPRKLADLVVRLSGKGGEYRQGNQVRKWEDYRTYTYSFWGYKKILKEAGFGRNDLYWTLSYNSPKYAGGFDGESFAFLLKLFKKNADGVKTLGSLLTLLGAHLPNWAIKFILPFVCPSFLIFAYKGDKNTSFESKLLQLEAASHSFVRISGSHGVNSKVSYFVLKDTKTCSILKFPRFTAGISSIEVEEGKMKQFNRLDIKEEVVDSVTVFVEPTIRGAQPQPYNLSHNLKVLGWLLDFQHKTQNGYWHFEQLEAKVTALSDFLSQIHIDHGVRLRTRQRMELLLESLRGIKLPITSEHGDFFTGNILIGDNGRIYVTDWEFYEENGEPLFDFIFLIVSNSVKGAMPKAFQDNFLGKGKHSPILEILLSEFAKAKGLPPKLVLQAVPYAILRCLHRAATGVDNKHLDIAFYLKLLVLWDEVCLSNYFPYTRHTSNSPLA